jgi:NAD(P)-dependent dehydrogenase (short-subunit alcohol dehydrogenase family)
MTTFQDQVVLVTGAGRGIGRALAEGFAARGARLAVNDITPGGLDETVARIAASGLTAKAFVADVASRMAVHAMIEEIREEYGRIDVLVNNAGVEPHASLLELDEWDWDRTLAVNLKGAFLLTQSVGRLMVEQGGGVILTAPVAGRTRPQTVPPSSKTGSSDSPGSGRAAAISGSTPCARVSRLR